MSQPSFRHVKANGINLRIAEMGDPKAPLVLFCHGWPESWYSWRHQLKAVAEAGFHAVAPDMRGYGESDAPQEIEGYTQLHLVGDMIELIKNLGHDRAVIVGHDWGAPVAWNSAMLRPDIIRAVCGMSVPWTPSGHVDFLSALEKMGITNFYMQYFQKPGVAEAEFEADIEATLRRVYFSGSGDGPERASFGRIEEGKGFLGNTIDPDVLPAWMNKDDIAYYASQFKKAGFRGGLNWYRNLTRSWSLFGPWRGVTIKQPSLFIAGARDGVLRFPASKQQIENFKTTLPGLRGCHIIDGAGHWIQRERAAEVNKLLVDFLKGL